MCHCCNTRVEQTENRSQHTKLTLKKKILPLLLLGFELTTFRSQVRRSNHWAVPAGMKGNAQRIWSCKAWRILLCLHKTGMKGNAQRRVRSCKVWRSLLCLQQMLILSFCHGQPDCGTDEYPSSLRLSCFFMQVKNKMMYDIQDQVIIQTTHHLTNFTDTTVLWPNSNVHTWRYSKWQGLASTRWLCLHGILLFDHHHGYQHKNTPLMLSSDFHYKLKANQNKNKHMNR